MDQLQLTRLAGQVKSRIVLPGSKSISNRLLIMDALSGTETTFQNLSDADDTILMKKALEGIKTCAASRIPMVVDTGNAGTVFRFLTALLAMTKGRWLLTGDCRMKKRPIGEMVDSLISLGANINYAENQAFPPLLINGTDLNSCNVEIDPSKSSQFVTALMLIAPHLKNGLKIKLIKSAVSQAYIMMTLQLMKQCGIEVEKTGNIIIVNPGLPEFKEITIEPDWSSASYWYEIVALKEGSEIYLKGFKKKSIQGDSICAELFDNLGVKTLFEKDGIRLMHSKKTVDSFEFDFSSYPDLVPAVMVTCAAKKVPAIFYGINHLKYKESDRIKSLIVELAKIGSKIEHMDNGIQLFPAKKNLPEIKPVFDTYKDHRMAMCLAPLVAVFEKVTINNPDVVLKSYLSFWKDIKSCGLALTEKI